MKVQKPQTMYIHISESDSQVSNIDDPIFEYFVSCRSRKNELTSLKFVIVMVFLILL